MRTRLLLGSAFLSSMAAGVAEWNMNHLPADPRTAACIR